MFSCSRNAQRVTFIEKPQLKMNGKHSFLNRKIFNDGIIVNRPLPSLNGCSIEITRAGHLTNAPQEFKLSEKYVLYTPIWKKHNFYALFLAYFTMWHVPLPLPQSKRLHIIFKRNFCVVFHIHFFWKLKQIQTQISVILFISRKTSIIL